MALTHNLSIGNIFHLCSQNRTKGLVSALIAALLLLFLSACFDAGENFDMSPPRFQQPDDTVVTPPSTAHLRVVSTESSVQPGWLEGALSNISDRDFFKFAQNSVTLEVTPTPDNAVVSVVLLVDGSFVDERQSTGLEQGFSYLTTFALDTTSLSEGTHSITYRALFSDGSALEESETFRVLLNVTKLLAHDDRVVWMGSFEFGLTAYDLGADPLDPSDDRALPYGAIDIQLKAEDTRNSYDTIGHAPGGHATSALALEPSGGLWYGSLQGGLTFLDDAGTPFDRSDDRYQYFLPSEHIDTTSGPDDPLLVAFRANSVTALLPTGTGVFLSTFQGLFYLDHNGTPLDSNDDHWTTFTNRKYDKNISALAADSAGRIWLSSFDLSADATDRNAVTVLDYAGTPENPNDDTWGRFESLTAAMPNKTYTIAVDDQDLKWIGTTDGLFVLDDNHTPFDPSDDAFARWGSDSGLPDNDIAAILPRADGKVWLGSFDLCGGAGGGLSLLDANAVLDASDLACGAGDPGTERLCSVLNPRADKLLVNYTLADGLLDSDVSSIVELPNGAVLIGTFNLLGAPVVSELLQLLGDSDLGSCGPDGNLGFHPGQDGLSVIATGSDLMSKEDDQITNL